MLQLSWHYRLDCIFAILKEMYNVKSYAYFYVIINTKQHLLWQMGTYYYYYNKK